jgi:hypothetical protein
MKSYEFINECDSGATSSASIAAGPAQNLFSKPMKRVKETVLNKSPVPANQKGKGLAKTKKVVESTLDEFAPPSSDGWGDRSGPSQIVVVVDKLLKAGNKVDCLVLGARGHVTGAELAGPGGAFGDSGLHLKKYNKPYARGGLYRPFIASDDSKYEIKMVGPKHYVIQDKLED